MLDIVLPILQQRNVSHKVICNMDRLRHLNGNTANASQIGKGIAIYVAEVNDPSNRAEVDAANDLARGLALEIDEALKGRGFNPPDGLTWTEDGSSGDRLIGESGLVAYRFGSFVDHSVVDRTGAESADDRYRYKLDRGLTNATLSMRRVGDAIVTDFPKVWAALEKGVAEAFTLQEGQRIGINLGPKFEENSRMMFLTRTRESAYITTYTEEGVEQRVRLEMGRSVTAGRRVEGGINHDINIDRRFNVVSRGNHVTITLDADGIVTILDDSSNGTWVKDSGMLFPQEFQRLERGRKENFALENGTRAEMRFGVDTAEGHAFLSLTRAEDGTYRVSSGDRTVVLEQGRVVNIGRSGDNTLAVGGAQVSMYHMTIEVEEDGSISLTDASTNGTWVKASRD